MAFINDVIVGTETEEWHNKIVTEVIKRLEENDLYIKPKKYKWKVRGGRVSRSGDWTWRG